VLLCVVVGAFGWLVERELRGAFESTAGERLGAAAQRLATMLATSAGTLRGDARRIAADSGIQAVLERPTPANLAAATALLSTTAAGRPDSGAHSLWTVRCERVLSIGSSKVLSTRDECPRGVTADTQRDMIQPLAVRGDSVVFSIIAPVVRAPAETLGYYVRARSLANAPNGRAVAALIGGDASLLIGNATGPEVWSDLSARASGPPRSATRGTLVRYTGADNVEYIGEAVDIPSTPWVVWVQMPVASMMAPANRALGKLTGIALGCILLGVIGVWFLSRRVTRPLADLTRAAEGMAAGDYARRVEGHRDDELGQLMAAFNQMASQVEKAKQALELSNLELSDSLAETRIAHHERELAQLLLEEVLDQSPVGIAVFNEELQFLRLNRALAAMNGVPVLEHIARTPDEIAPALRTVEESALRRVIETGQIISNQHSSGALLGGAKRYWMSSYFPVRGVLGETTGAGAIILETTAHHELEAQLLQAQKMEAVGRLAGGVAHDFNNLLTVISSYSEMALETLAPDDPLYGDMREIRSSADRASRLTRQLLAFSRKQVMQPQVLDLNRVSTEMERMLRRLIGEDVTLALDLTRELGEIKADPGQIEQVLMNLVLNARDATPDGGRLTIATANVSLASDVTHDGVRIPAGEYVTLSVIDTGSGMTEETKAHLFEPFFTTKDSGHGTGLGLSTVYGIVKQSGGEIHVHSEMGRGSTFTAYFPRLARERGRLTPPGSMMPYDYGGSETILVVEDDEALRGLAQRILRSAGYLVLEASNANMAIEVGTMYEGEIHLLLTDVVMPQQNGRTVGARLTALRPSLRVLFMSGYNDEDVLRRGVSTAKSQFLQKPFTPEQLMRRVREVLDDSGGSQMRAG
jgi:signal transduction histidine kinase/ActR/RegA family two-component response regulator